MAAKKKSQTKQLVMRDGSVFCVIGETCKYWLCDGTKFRKANPNILRIETVSATAEKEG